MPGNIPTHRTSQTRGFKRIEELEDVLSGCGFELLQIPKEALFLAGKTYLKYRKRKGIKMSPLPDFFIGAHAAVDKLELIKAIWCDSAKYLNCLARLSLWRVLPDVQFGGPGSVCQ